MSGRGLLRGALRHLKRMAREAAGRGEALEDDDRKLQEDIREYFDAAGDRQRQAAARKKRKKRGVSPQNRLRLRALQCVLRESPNIKAEELLERLDADGRITYDDKDVELLLDDAGDIVVRDLRTGAKLTSASIKAKSLRKYLADARNT